MMMEMVEVVVVVMMGVPLLLRWYQVLLLVCTVYHTLPFASTDGLNWTLTSSNESISVGGQVPGGVYSDLLAANVLSDGDFYYRYNDLAYRWVSKENWTYSTVLNVDGATLNHTRVTLVFEGLDTAASVFLNDHCVGKSDNMFVRYQFDVKNHLQESKDNTLEVRFESPVEYAARQYDIQSAKYVVPPKCVSPVFKGECHANHIRKMQASFSWDWGPAFPNSGIWKNWHLAAWNSLRVSDIIFSAVPTSVLPSVPDHTFKPGWIATIKVWCDAAVEEGEVPGSLIIALGDIYTRKHQVIASVAEYKALLEFNVTFSENQVDMWWPNGYGEHPLYQLTANWTSQDKRESSLKTVKVGFRTVELNQDYVVPSDRSKGRHYRIFVNNVFIFMKGSNWVPAHVLPEKVDPQYTRHLLQAAVDTHQNCIRVWGGGIYETDVFYEIADELGILVWEDLMFACSMYPADQDFLDTVNQEVVTQVRRLQHHPSILLWASNNENEVALRRNWYGTFLNFDQYKKDYVTLYVDTIRTAVQEEDDSRPFVVSSPSNGIQSEQEGYVAKDPYDNRYGDVHYYAYILDGWDGKYTPLTRFCSEYGYQSWPSFVTMQEVSIEEDWDRESDLMYHRQHHPLGQQELALQIGLHMHMPPQDGSVKAYKDYLYLTQVHQAVAVKTETEVYRRWMSEINEKGEGYISGALYWQLNDIWQGASWASIEYGGRWKMVHYYAKKFFNPIIITSSVENKIIKVYIVNEVFEGIKNASLMLKLHRYDTLGPIHSISRLISVEAAKASQVAAIDLNADMKLGTECQEGLYDPEDVCFLTLHLLDSKGDPLAPDTFHLLGKPKDAHILAASVEIHSIEGPISTRNSEWTFNITLKTDSVALFVWLETPTSGVFSDNGFIMTQGDVALYFYGSEETCVDDLKASLSVKSLTDTYRVNHRGETVPDYYFHPNHINVVVYL